MRDIELIQDLFNQYLKKHPNSSAKVEDGGYDFIHLLDFARNLRVRLPIYEMAYQYLVHQFVLRGSRADILATLDRCLRAAVAGQSVLILIEGVSGIGKTSLAMVQQVQAHELGAAFIVGRCYKEGTTPFWLWQDIVRSIEKLTAASLDLLPVPFGKGAETRSIQHLIQSLEEWLIACATNQPLVILLDDLHWADSDSLEVLNVLTSHTGGHPILFMATYRTEETHRGHPLYGYLPLLHRNRAVETLRLHPLTRTDTAQIVAAQLGPCHPLLADYLYQRAEGHPLFTVELLHDLVDRGFLSQNTEGLWLPPDQSVPVPTLLKHVILQRIARLGDAAEKLLSHAAVVGETWTLPMVEVLVELTEDVLLDALENVIKADLVHVVNEQTEVYQFSHGLIREVLYTGQLTRRRKRLHERIGYYLENQEPLNSAHLAHHFYEAENPGKSLQYCLEAGDEAAKSFASHQAIELYQKALDAAQRHKPDIDARRYMDIYEHLGRAYRILDQQVEAETAFSRMRDAAHRAGDLKSEGFALVNLAHVRISQYQLDLAVQTAKEALKIAEALGDSRLLAQTHGCLGKVLLIRGQLGASMYHFKQYHYHSEALNDSATQSDTFRGQAYVALWAGRYEEAEALAQQCLEHGLKSGNLLYISGGYQILSFCQIEWGKYVEAYQNIHLILEQTETTNPYHHQLARLLNQMGFLFLELGDGSQALMWDQRALEASQRTRGTGRYEMKRYSLLNIATDLLHLGRVDEAFHTAAHFEAMKESPDYTHFRYHNRYLLLRSELHLARSQFTQSIEFAEQARAFAQRFGASKNIAKSHWFEGQGLLEMQQHPAAVQHLRQAVAIADEIQHGSLRWKIRLSLAKALIRVEKSPDEVTEKARALIRQTGHSLADSSLRDSFSESRWIAQIDELERPQAPEKPLYPAGLTQREVEVLRQVARGATNQQIAAILHISVRTVDTHITNILNKTNCENRTAATVYAIQQGLV